jgi:hypothetical protein
MNAQAHTTRGGVVMAVAFSVCLDVSHVAAQVAGGGSIRGYVTDELGGVLRDASVVATSTTTPVTHRAVTDAAGDYRLANLPPGDYVVVAESPGFSRVVRNGVGVREGLNLQVDLMLTLGPASETVVVAGAAPMLEATTAVRAVNISGDLQRALPLSGLRTWADVLLMVPGVATSQTRLQTYFLHGTNQSSGVFLVDGADATSVLQGSTLFSQFGRETFSDVQVTTAGVEARAPLGLGAVVNIATRSGINRVQGAASMTIQPKRWNGSNTPGGQDLTVDTRQPDGAMGGPIARDRLWAFGSARIDRNHTGNPRTAQQVAFLEAIAPDFSPFDNQWRSAIGFVKVTGRLGRGHDLMASASRDVVTLGGAQPNEAAPFRSIVLGGPGFLGRLSSVWTASLVTRVSAGYNGKKQETRNLQPQTTGVTVHERTFPSNGVPTGTGAIVALDASPSAGSDFDVHFWTVTLDATWHHRGPLGGHEITTGLYLQPRRHNRRVTRYNNSGFQVEDRVLREPGNLAGGSVPFHRRVFDVGTITTTELQSRDVAGYVQDAWRIAGVTITGGVRIDAIERTDRIFNLTMQRSTEIGPRLGVAWTMTSDQRNTLRASWGRIHENLSLNETQGGTNTAGFRDLYDSRLDGTFSTVFVTPPARALARNLVVDLARYHQGHVNEATVGYRRQLAEQTSVDVNLLHRAYRERPTALEINGIYNDGVFAGFRDPSQNEIYQLTANRWNWPVVVALQAQVTRRSARTTFVAGYTREWNHLAGTWQPNDPASFIQPSAFRNANGIGGVGGCTSGGALCPDGNSLLAGFGGGTWRNHVINSGATWLAPWGLQFATTYNFQTGPWSGPIQTLAAADPRFGPPSIALSNGRVVQNPLSTAVRFAYSTRGEGQYRLGALHLWNARAGRTFSIGAQRLGAAVDVLNVVNAAADQAIQPGGNQQFSPFFRVGGLRQFPRAVQVSARLEF